MKTAIPFLLDAMHKTLDKIDDWCEKKIEENKKKEGEHNEDNNKRL